MAGYYDAQGVWMHAEADTFPLTSEVLNRSPKSISDVLKPLKRIKVDADQAVTAAGQHAVDASLSADRAEAAALITKPLVAPLDEGIAALINSTTSDTNAAVAATVSAEVSEAVAPFTPTAAVTAGKTMQKGAAGATRTVALTGHSLMYGMDSTPAGTNPPVNGAGITRSTLPTPERFDIQADYLSPGPVTVINQAFPGDRSAEALTRWSSGVSGDIEFFWIDTNDGLSSGAGPALTDAQTAANLRDLIKRSRSRGVDVVVVGGAPAPADADSRKIFATAEANRTIAQRMGARYVDAGELLNALPKALPMFSSGVHFQKEGYNLVGTRLSALLGPKGTNPPKVAPGRIFTPRDGVHTLRGGGAVLARTGAADGSVWQLPNVAASVAIAVEVTAPCVPLIRARVNGTTEGFGVVSLDYSTGGSGRSSRYVKLTASTALAAPGFVYFQGVPLTSPGPDSVVAYCRSGNIEIDSIEFVPIQQGQYVPSDTAIEQNRTKQLRLTPVGGASSGRYNASWDAAFDTLSDVATATGSAGTTNVDTRWLFDLTLGASNSGVVLAQSLYSANSPQPYGFAQGYLFIRNGTSLIARKLDAGSPTDVVFPAAFAAASGFARCSLEIHYNPSSDLFTIYLDGASVGTIPAPTWKFYTVGLIAGVAAGGGYAAGSGTVVQKASATI